MDDDQELPYEEAMKRRKLSSISDKFNAFCVEKKLEARALSCVPVPTVETA
jgi:hypothetical protein